MVSGQYLKLFANRYKFALPLLELCSKISPNWVKIVPIWKMCFSDLIYKPTFVNALGEANSIGLIEFTYSSKCKKRMCPPYMCELMRVPLKHKKVLERYFEESQFIQIDELHKKFNNVCYPKNPFCPMNLQSSRSTIDDLDLVPKYTAKTPFEELIILPPLQQIIYCTLYRWIKVHNNYETVSKKSIVSPLHQITSLDHEEISRAIDKLAETELIIKEDSKSLYALNDSNLPEFDDLDPYVDFLTGLLKFSTDIKQRVQSLI